MSTGNHSTTWEALSQRYVQCGGARGGRAIITVWEAMDGFPVELMLDSSPDRDPSRS